MFYRSIGMPLSYLLVAVWPVSGESEPGDHPALVLEVLRQFAPRYDTPRTYTQLTFIHCEHTIHAAFRMNRNVLKFVLQCIWTNLIFVPTMKS